MNLLDSNIIIYSPYPNYAHLRSLVSDSNNSVSIITMVEVLGYHQLTSAHKKYFENVFKMLKVIDLDFKIIQTAIQLKQSKKYSLGDSIIAATAIQNNLTLLTNNEKDFKDISDLNVVNPI